MIYELRTYTTVVGEVAAVAKNSGEVARAIRGDDYGKLEGYWVTDIGPLNQVMHLWSYESLEQRRRLRVELSRNERWVNEYLPLIRPKLLRQEIRLMEAFLPLKPPAGEGNVYEFRNYRIHPGRAREWAGHFEAVMPAREKYSKNVCAWVCEAGEPNEVCHLWAYADLNERGAVRAAAGKDAQWQAFLEKSVSLIAEAHSTILLPAAHSPMK